jgi:chitodextrinase
VNINFTHDLPNLIPGTTYYFQAYAGTEKGEVLSFKTLPLAAPANLRVINITAHTISLTWNESAGATGYDVYKNDSLYESVTGTSCTVSGLVSGTEYSFYVKATYGDVSSDSSSTLSRITIPSPPEAPVFSDITPNSVTLTWKPVQGADYYEIHRFYGKFLVYVGRTESPDVTYTAEGLLPDTTYSFCIKAGNAAGTSEEGFTESVTTLAADTDETPAEVKLRELRTAIQDYFDSIAEESIAWGIMPATDDVNELGLIWITNKEAWGGSDLPEQSCFEDLFEGDTGEFHYAWYDGDRQTPAGWYIIYMTYTTYEGESAEWYNPIFD